MWRLQSSHDAKETFCEGYKQNLSLLITYGEN
jgi:hypothetical protein